MKFGEMIRDLRIGRRSYLSGRELAKKLGWSPVKISRIEKGLEIPSKEEIEKIGEALGLGKSAIDQLIKWARQSEVEPEKSHGKFPIVCKRPDGSCVVIETELCGEKMEKIY